MFQNIRHLIKITKSPDNWILALVFFIAAFFLVLKGTATTGLFLVALICAFQIVKDPQHYFAARGSQFWMLILCLLTPFLAELLVHIGRGNFVWANLDGPSRAILATGVFIYLSRKDCSDLLSVLGIGSALGILLVFFSLQVFPEYYWGDRAATYFVDPITLPCYVVVLLGIYLFGDYSRIPKTATKLISFLVCLLTIYIAIESQSRSAWVAGVAMVAVYLLYSLKGLFLKQILATLALALGIFIIYIFSDVVSSRVSSAIEGMFAFMESGGGQQSSTGQRAILLLIDLELIKDNLFFGIADGVMPTYEYLKSRIPSINESIYEIKVVAGSHSEVLAQLVRKGLFLGGFALWGLFLYPLYLVSCRLRVWSTADQGLAAGIFGLIVPVFFSGLTIQVFNLKMTMSFYMLCLAIFLAYCLPRTEASERGLKS